MTPTILDELTSSRDFQRLLDLTEGVTNAVALAYRAFTELSFHGRTTHDVFALAQAVVEYSNGHAKSGEDEPAMRFARLAFNLIFHHNLHLDGLSSPLVERTDAYLSLLDSSLIWQDLVRPVPRADEEGSVSDGNRVAVTHGTTATFTLPLLDVLSGQPDAQVTYANLLTSSPGLNRNGIDPDILAFRRAAALGRRPQGYAGIRQMVAGNDILFLDWADKIAVVASVLAPTRRRVIVRMHSADFFRPWVHLIDWSNVDVLICVSDFMADFARDLLGERLADTEVQVLPNLLSTPGLAPTGRAQPTKVLGMVGWGKRVKDPIWALEVLEELHARDEPGEPWSLLLIGSDFSAAGNPNTSRYQEKFHARLKESGLASHVFQVGQTTEVARYVQRCSFILSTSRRESFHLGLIEGMLTGAVPIVRDWPIFERYRGAASLYGEDVVFDSPRAAADAISAIAAGHSGDQWRDTSARAVEHAKEILRADEFNDRLRAIVFGTPEPV